LERSGAAERRSRHPRGNPQWPKVGISRNEAAPAGLGATIVHVLGRNGGGLEVAGLDAVDGTPVLDIKPVMREFLPRERMRQPSGRANPWPATGVEIIQLSDA